MSGQEVIAEMQRLMALHKENMLMSAERSGEKAAQKALLLLNNYINKMDSLPTLTDAQKKKLEFVKKDALYLQQKLNNGI